MVELLAKSPCAGHSLVTHGGATLAEIDAQHLTWLSPLKGQGAALSQALKAAHGLDWPAPGRMSEHKGARCLWVGMDQAMLMGVAPGPGLAQHAAVSAQSDGWTVLQLDGPAGAQVLARLVPIDLRASAFGPGQTARTLCGHMTVTLARTAPDSLLVLGFRSMAATLWHEIEAAMVSVAAQGLSR